MSISKRGVISLFLIFLSFMLGTTTSTGFSLGDQISLDLGVTPWSNGQTGFHYLIIIPFVLLIIGILEAQRVIPGRRLAGLIILFMLLSPIAANVIKQAYFGMHNGLAAIEYSPVKSHFYLKSSEDNKDVEANGTIVLTNHGRYPVKVGIKLSPSDQIKQEWFSQDIALTETYNSDEPGLFTIPPGETRSISTFTRIPSQNVNNVQGSMNGPNLILYTDNEIRLVGTNL